MKTVKNRIIAVGFAMAVAFALWAPETTNAADQVKGAEKLMSKPVTTLGDLSAIRPGDMMVMSCPKCKNATVHYVEPTFKATESRDKVKTVHTCPGCNSTISLSDLRLEGCLLLRGEKRRPFHPRNKIEKL